MAISPQEQAILDANRIVLLRVKADLATLAASCSAMSALQTTERARLACDRTKAGFSKVLEEVRAVHAAIGEDLIVRFGADGEAYVMGGGGRR